MRRFGVLAGRPRAAAAAVATGRAGEERPTSCLAAGPVMAAARGRRFPAASAAQPPSPGSGRSCAVAVAIAAAMRDLRALSHGGDRAVDAAGGRGTGSREGCALPPAASCRSRPAWPAPGQPGRAPPDLPEPEDDADYLRICRPPVTAEAHPRRCRSSPGRRQACCSTGHADARDQAGVPRSRVSYGAG
jgi:hypothetical protein